MSSLRVGERKQEIQIRALVILLRGKSVLNIRYHISTDDICTKLWLDDLDTKIILLPWFHAYLFWL